MKEEILNKIKLTNKNVIISGDMSAGKSCLAGKPYLKNVIDNNENFCVLDSKEEYVTKYYELCKEKDYDISVINLRDYTKSDGWNPLELPYKIYKSGNKDKAYNYVEQLSKTLFFDNSSSDPFWSLSAKDFFMGLVFMLFDDAKVEEINFNSVVAVLNAGEAGLLNKDLYVSYFERKDKNSMSYNCASATVFAPKETKGSIVATAKQKINYLSLSEGLSKILSKTTIKKSDKPRAIFIIGKDEESNINDIAVMFIQQLFTELIDNSDYKKFNFILDNFDSLKNFDRLIDILGASAFRKIKFLIITRSMDKLVNRYGDYINKLCENIHIDSNEVFYDEEHFVNNNVNHDYKINDKISIFNLQSFLGYDDNTEKKEVDDLLKLVNKKITEIDKEEQELLDNLK